MTDKKSPMAAETNDFDFDFDDKPAVTEQDIKAANNMRENIKKQNTINDKEVEKRAMAAASAVKQNTITEKEIKDHEEDDFPDYDFGITSTKPTMIRKIDCTSLDEAEKHFVCLALTIRDQTKRKSLLNDQLIRIRFVEGEFEARMDFIADIIKVVVESKRLEANGKKYFFKALKKSMVNLLVELVELVEEEFEDLDQLINEEIEKNS